MSVYSADNTWEIDNPISKGKPVSKVRLQIKISLGSLWSKLNETVCETRYKYGENTSGEIYFIGI